MKGKHWPRELVAVVKAARALGISAKTTSYITGVGKNTIHAWWRGADRADVPPDPAFRERFAALFDMCSK
jgi:hypothetical protein